MISALAQSLSQCDYVQIQNLATGSLLTSTWEDGLCHSMQLMERETEDSHFLISVDEDLSTSLWTEKNPNVMVAIEGQQVVCSAVEQQRYNLVPFGEPEEGYLIEVEGDMPKYLSSQDENTLLALYSLETVEDMKMYAKEAGDQSSQWIVKCKQSEQIL